MKNPAQRIIYRQRFPSRESVFAFYGTIYINQSYVKVTDYAKECVRGALMQ